MSVSDLNRPAVFAVGALLLGFCFLVSLATAVDNSPAPSLQYYESTYANQYERIGDVFVAGYGTLWVPPAGRASSGNQSVGYDPRDRFDLGAWDNNTLYGSEKGLRSLAQRVERTGGALLVDLVWNHNGFQYDDTPGFVEAGGYPGFVLQNPDGGQDPFGVPGTNGDFHSPFAGGNDARFGGLIDIDHSSNHTLIRNPVGPNPGNVPAGTGDWFGETFNVPDPNNARFYPDTDLPPILLFNPSTGENDIAVYPFNKQNPLAGDPLPENALGYLMRNVRWMVEDVGVEGFRLDIPWHFPEWVMGYFDQATYRASERRNLDGSQYHAFSFMEAGRGQQDELVRRFVRKTIDDQDPGRIGSNYDALDFEFFHSLEANLTGNGLQNDWRNVVNSSLDREDDGLMNGSAGIKFAQSHDDVPPQLGNVAHAYTLMLPGQANVYFNAKQHGGGRDFPRDGRGDALGGVYGETLTTLVGIRNTHGRGNFQERLLEKETYIFERSGAALIGLSNRLDGGYDERRVDINLPWGTTLVELTGASIADGDIPELITVDDDFFGGPTKATLRVPRNDGGDRGYVIYGLPTPQSTEGIEFLQDSSPVSIIAGGSPAQNDFENGGTRLSDRHVITGDQFVMRLATQAVTVSGTRLENGQLVQRSVRDRDADGDNALFRFDGGRDLNGINPFGTVSGVDFDSGSVVYGFEQFTTVREPGYESASGDGLYEQAIDTSLLEEGEHYVTVRAFRRRDDGGPAVYQDFREVIYVDRLAPESAIDEIRPVNAGGSGDHDILIESLDLTANSIHVFLNLPEIATDEALITLAQAGQGGSQMVDVGLFKFFASGAPAGNNAITVVSFEVTGTTNVQRFTGVQLANGIGAGVADVNHDGVVTAQDVTGAGSFETFLYAQGSRFNPAADVNGDGRITNLDLFDLGQALLDANADSSAISAYQDALVRRGDLDGSGATDQLDLQTLYANFGNSDWLFDLNADGVVDDADVETLVRDMLKLTPGDFNLDGVVDAADFATWRNHFGQPQGSLLNDTDGGPIGVAQLATWRANFGTGIEAPVSAALAVPEPGTHASVLVGMAALFLGKSWKR